MSQSRLEKIGTIYSRLSALIKAGSIRPEYRPVWFDIYKTFPPKYEPRWDRKPENEDEPVPKILYREDVVRAQFYRQFGDRVEAFNLLDHGTEATTLSQVFVNKYAKLESAAGGETSFEAMFRETIDALELDGVKMRNVDPEAARGGERWDKRVTEVRGDPEEELRGGGDGAKLGAISFRELFSKQTQSSDSDR